MILIVGIHGVGKTTIGKRLEKDFILEGHICLLNRNNKIKAIDISVFKKLNPEMMVVIVESEKIVAERNKSKSEKLTDENFLISFQKEEIKNAKKIGKTLRIPILIINNDEKGYCFLRKYMEVR